MNLQPVRRRPLLPLVPAIVACPLLTLSAAPPVAAMPGATAEIRVNTTTVGAQLQPAVASDADGDHVVVWTSVGQDGSAGGIYSQRYGSNGAARGPETQVHTTTAGAQGEASVAMDATGDYVVVWTSLQDGSGFGVYAQRYDAAGVPQGAETRVNITTDGDQSLPAVAMDAAGNYVVSWTSSGQDGDLNGVFARRFNASGVPFSGEIWVNTTSTGDQAQPTIAMDADGDFVVAWHSSGQDGSGYGVYAQRFNAVGEAQGSETRVNTTTASDQRLPAVAMDADGDFVVAWASTGQDGSGSGIYAQRFTSAGAAQGTETRVNTTTTDHQQQPAVAMDADGDHAIAWQSLAQDGADFGVYTQRYDALGAPQGTETRVNATTPFAQADPAVASDADGDLVFTWYSETDGSVSGIYARRARGPATVDLRVAQADNADPIAVGGRLVYRVRVFNRTAPSEDSGVPTVDGAVGSATGVRVVTTPPDGATLESAAGPGWACGSPGSVLTCRQATPVPAGGVAPTLVLTYTAPTAAGSVLHLAEVSDRHVDPSTADNLEVERTNVMCSLEFSEPAFAHTEAGNLIATVTRHGTGCGASGVSYTTQSASATAGADYTNVSGTLSWADGDTDQAFAVPLINDGLDERTEQLNLLLSNPTGALLDTRSLAAGNVLDNDDPPRINFSTTTGTAAEPGALVRLTAELSEISGQQITVVLAKAGTATYLSDYYAPKRLTIPAGQLTASFTLEVADDNLVEGPELAVIALAAPTGATLGSQKTYRLTIADDD